MLAFSKLKVEKTIVCKKRIAIEVILNVKITQSACARQMMKHSMSLNSTTDLSCYERKKEASQ